MDYHFLGFGVCNHFSLSETPILRVMLTLADIPAMILCVLAGHLIFHTGMDLRCVASLSGAVGVFRHILLG